VIYGYFIIFGKRLFYQPRRFGRQIQNLAPFPEMEVYYFVNIPGDGRVLDDASQALTVRMENGQRRAAIVPAGEREMGDTRAGPCRS
jgi:hypothetical protein